MKAVAQIQFKLQITKIYDDLLFIPLYFILIKSVSFVHYYYQADFL